MANKISISTEDLRKHALDLAKLSTQMNDIHTKAKRAITLIHEATNSKYSSEMKRQGTKLLNNAYDLADKLSEGCIIAVRAAENFENTDKIIRESIKNLPDEVLAAPPSNQIVTNSYQKAINTINSLTDGQYHTVPDFGQCIGYANWVFKQMFGDIFWSYTGNFWELSKCSTIEQIGSCVYDRDNFSSNDLAALLGLAKPGDVLQMYWSGGTDGSCTQHTMIFKELAYDENNNVVGFYTLEGNSNGNFANKDDGFSGIDGRQHYYTIDYLYDRLDFSGGGISVNHATNYDQIMGE